MTGTPHLRRPLRVAALALVALVALSGCLSQAQTRDVTLINQARAAAGKRALGVHAAAASKAQAWSEHMARTGVLEHTGGGGAVDPAPLRGWCSYYENVGMGGSVDAVHKAFLASPSHKANMLSSSTVVGTGVVARGGRVWVTEIYLRTC